MNKKLIFGMVPFLLVTALLGITGGVNGCDYLNRFEKTIDPGDLGSNIDSCLLCHINPAGGGSLNSYGTDFANNTHNFTIIEQLDSDGDGFTNIAEIHARSFPGNASDYPVTSTLNSTLYGVEFYASNCQSCHNPLATSTMQGRTAAQIKIAINTEPAMSSLSVLSLVNIQAIANALASPNSTSTTALDGPTLYSSYCAGCHRPLATSAKLGRTVDQIRTSITTVSSMSFLYSLRSDQIQDIANALAANQTPTPKTILYGPDLYAGNCAGCHNQLAFTTKPGRTAAQIQNAITTVSVMNSLSLTMGQLMAIANALPVAPTPTSTITPTTTLNGATLYTTYCASCHNPLASTTKPGRTATQIQNSISSVSSMNSLSTLSSSHIQALATAMAVAPTPTPTPSPTPSPTTTPNLNGATLYTTYCAGCHNPLASTTKPGRTALQIQNSITSVSSMNSLSTLSSAQIQVIATALAVAPTPTPTPQPTPNPTPTPSLNGATLYATYCAGCHNPLASTTKPGRTALQIQNSITSVSSMNSLSTLSSAHIQAIATALAVAPTPTPTPQPTPNPTPTPSLNGTTLYATYCAGCHNPLASTTKPGRTALQIQNSISSVSSMNSLSTLSSAQIQAIATALATIPIPTDGASLYASYCSSCHNTLASSDVKTSSASKITSAINEKSEMRSISLTSTQIEAIAGALAV